MRGLQRPLDPLVRSNLAQDTLEAERVESVHHSR